MSEFVVPSSQGTEYPFGKRVTLICVVDGHGFIGDSLACEKNIWIERHRQFFGCNGHIKEIEYVPSAPPSEN